MRWNDKRYHSLNYELRKVFGCKVFKLSLNGNFTCPNRDGLISNSGCIFCSEKGSGDFAGSNIFSIKDQINEQINLLSKKWTSGKYISYFQSFTNTYDTADNLRKKYNEAISCDNVVGLAVATRPDCLSDDVIDVLDEFNKKTYMWVELGLQTIHESTAKLINRGYELSVFDKAIEKLRKRNINVVVHLILGLPFESRNDMLSSVKYISNLDIQGVKLHLMHILKNTYLETFYKNNQFHILTQDEYVSLVVDCIEILPPSVVIHRITGDGPKDLLIEPKWSLNKRAVLNAIEKELRDRDSYQGMRFKKPTV
ncbi:TIGR01212 family radical SAM protein [Alkalithermobacter paradoxus]|uniref:Ribosomal protein S12 methylthiotransferase RimO n=1 Tax=Alkalithermobacter paradoxus TaxID=29349 RepID=A0A1V4IAT1_9FIRM|nr:ribosomal protein S12 methylthiotransferase RimO [[Clostridium] thermoalcaliphilum]